MFFCSLSICLARKVIIIKLASSFMSLFQHITISVIKRFFYFPEHFVVTEDGEHLHYKKLCICTGGRPNIISKHACVVGIRDTESVKQFKRKLSKARRVVIIGNGGIALELVYAGLLILERVFKLFMIIMTYYYIRQNVSFKLSIFI